MGETLSADPGTWTNDPDHFEYQWITCDGFRITCESIPGATEATYVIRAADANQSIGLDASGNGSGWRRSARSWPARRRCRRLRRA